MAILGGSPLGLIGVRSTPSRDGMSTFNAGKSRNVNINKYNAGKPTVYDKKVNVKDGMVSLFTGGSKVKAWANIGAIGSDKDSTGLKDDFKGSSRSTLHNNDIYDTSLLNIIEKLSETSAGLRPSDFAYLKDLGVYPNNRLMIARRFAAPVADNIFRKSRLPAAVMISWKPEGEDFFEITFGEHWEDSQADFTEILNSMGSDFLGKGAGKAVGGALGAIPLPGFTEGLQRAVLGPDGLGILDDTGELLPAGNPNLIKIAKKRKTIEYGKAGSGLKCDFSVKMVCEYEQKFISGIDPTIVWQDLLATILKFGTSVSADYGLNDSFGAMINRWARDPGTMVSDFAKAISTGIKAAKQGMIDALTKEYDDKEAARAEEESLKENAEDPDELTEQEKLANDKATAVGALTKLLGTIAELGIDSIKKTVRKYEVEVRGIVAALTGGPSTPWHITLGNPLRPIFCSGDMLVDSVSLKAGPDLAFNDLPSRITVEFTMKNARPWGLQEIAARFNTGNIRVVNTIRDFTTLTPSQSLQSNPLQYSKPEEDKTNGAVEGGNGNSAVSNTTAGDNNSNSGVTTENKEVEVISPEAGSGSETPSVITEGANTTTPPTPEQIASAASGTGN